MESLAVFIPWIAIGFASSILLACVRGVYAIALRVGDITRKRRAIAGTKRYYIY